MAGYCTVTKAHSLVGYKRMPIGKLERSNGQTALRVRYVREHGQELSGGGAKLDRTGFLPGKVREQ